MKISRSRSSRDVVVRVRLVGLLLLEHPTHLRELALVVRGGGAAGRSRGAWRSTSASRPGWPARPRPATAPAPRRARPGPAPRPGPRRRRAEPARRPAGPTRSATPPRRRRRVGSAGHPPKSSGPNTLQDLALALPAGPQVPVQDDEPGGPLHGLLLRAHLVDRVADDLLGLGERPVGDRQLSAGQLDPDPAGRARREPAVSSSAPARVASSPSFMIASIRSGRRRRGRLVAVQQHQVAHRRILSQTWSR